MSKTYREIIYLDALRVFQEKKEKQNTLSKMQQKLESFLLIVQFM